MRRRHPAKRARPVEGVTRLTKRQAEALAERDARAMLGCSFRDACAMLDRGELRDTIAEAEITMLRALVDA